MMRTLTMLAFSAGLATAVQAQTAAPAPAQQPQRPVPPAEMDRAALEAEVAAARPFIRNGGVRAVRPAGCTGAEQRQFDFWLGEWDVSPTGQTFVLAESTISLHGQGCVIMENWRPLAGAHGYSINMYDAADGKWHQTYGDATGRRTVFAGAMDGEVLRLENLSAPPPSAPPDLRRRMNFQRIDADTVHQWGETFRDGVWTTTFDFTYRRRPGTRP